MLGAADDVGSGRGRARSTHRRRAARRPRAARAASGVSAPLSSARSTAATASVSRLGFAADEGEIAARREKPRGRGTDAPPAPDRGHLEIVAQDEASEAEPPAEEPVMTPADSDAGHSGSSAE